MCSAAAQLPAPRPTSKPHGRLAPCLAGAQKDPLNAKAEATICAAHQSGDMSFLALPCQPTSRAKARVEPREQCTEALLRLVLQGQCEVASGASGRNIRPRRAD
eukprot:scaffold51841_cov27-Tisochrysis_lutea.AAC.2